MNVEYKRDLNHNYLILTGKQQEGESYQSKMMERNKVHGILPCSARYVDDVVKYYYDISSKQPLAAAFSIRKMNYQLVSSIFMQMEQIFHELDNYLLDSSRILLDVRYMYWDVEAEKIHFIFYPLQEKGEDSVQKFAEELLNLVDYADKKAVDAVYWFYQKATAENFTLCEAFAYFKEQGVGADLSMKEAQNANTGGNRQQERTDVDWHEQSGNKADYRDGYQDYDTEDEDTENESDERFRGERNCCLPSCVYWYLRRQAIF